MKEMDITGRATAIEPSAPGYKSPETSDLRSGKLMRWNVEADCGHQDNVLTLQSKLARIRAFSLKF